MMLFEATQVAVDPSPTSDAKSAQVAVTLPSLVVHSAT
jgi:hypothetical protein